MFHKVPLSIGVKFTIQNVFFTCTSWDLKVTKVFTTSKIIYMYKPKFRNKVGMERAILREKDMTCLVLNSMLLMNENCTS